MNSWNVDIEQRQRYLACAESSHIASIWKSLAYLLVSIVLLLQNRITIICIMKFRINNIVFAIKGNSEGHYNWNMD